MDSSHRTGFTGGRSLRGLFMVTCCLMGCAVLCAAPAWLQVVGEGYVVLTADKPSEAIAAAEEFRQFKFALDSMLTVDTKNLPPLTLVILRHRGYFDPYRPRSVAGKPQNVAGFFSRNIDWSVAALAERWGEGDGKRVLQHEAVHWFLSGANFDPPLWFDEGMAEVFSTYGRRKREPMWGEPIPQHIMYLRDEKPMPIERLLNIKTSDAVYDETERGGKFYATAWLFIHYLLYGQHDIPPQAINTFLSSEMRPGNRRDAFVNAFGLDYAGMDAALKSYLRKGSFSFYVSPILKTAPLTATKADPLVVAIALARVSIGGDNPDQAAVHLEEVRRMSPDSVVVDELAGYIARVRGDYISMRASFARASEKGSRDAGVYYWSALSGVASSSTPNPDGYVELIENTDLDRMADLHLKTLQLRPDWQPSYDELARISMKLPNARPADHDALLEGFKRYPFDAHIAASLAFLDFRDKNFEQAFGLMHNVLEVAINREDPALERLARDSLADWEFMTSAHNIRLALSENDVATARAEFTHMERAAPPHHRTELLSIQQQIESRENRPALKP